MNSDDLKRLQELAVEAKDKLGAIVGGLPEPNFDPMRDAIEKLRAIEQATNPANSLQSIAQAASPRPVVTMNRKQRRKAGAKAKRPNSNPAIHAYAERVRRMSDAQIWAEGHKEPDLHTVEAVVRDIHEDLLSVLAPHFDDHTMKRIADVLGDWYGFDKDVIFQDGNTPLDDAKYVATAYAEGGKTPLVVGQVYRHFKGNYYRIVALAKMATALELEDDGTLQLLEDDGTPQCLDGMDVVVYQSMNPNHPDWVFVRPIFEFVEPTPEAHTRQDKTIQQWRFMLVEEKEAIANAAQ